MSRFEEEHESFTNQQAKSLSNFMRKLDDQMDPDRKVSIEQLRDEAITLVNLFDKVHPDIAGDLEHFIDSLSGSSPVTLSEIDQLTDDLRLSLHDMPEIFRVRPEVGRWIVEKMAGDGSISWVAKTQEKAHAEDLAERAHFIN